MSNVFFLTITQTEDDGKHVNSFVMEHRFKTFKEAKEFGEKLTLLKGDDYFITEYSAINSWDREALKKIGEDRRGEK